MCSCLELKPDDELVGVSSSSVGLSSWFLFRLPLTLFVGFVRTNIYIDSTFIFCAIY
jgi:hypothetical protein